MTLDTVFCQLYFRGGAVTIHRGSSKKCCCCDNAAAWTAIADKPTHRDAIFFSVATYNQHPLCHEHRASKIDDYAKPVIIAAAPKETLLDVYNACPWIRPVIASCFIFVPLIMTIVTHPALKREPNNSYSPTYNPPLVFTPVNPYAGPSYAEQRAKSAQDTQDAIDKYRQRK